MLPRCTQTRDQRPAAKLAENISFAFIRGSDHGVQPPEKVRPILPRGVKASWRLRLHLCGDASWLNHLGANLPAAWCFLARIELMRRWPFFLLLFELALALGYCCFLESITTWSLHTPQTVSLTQLALMNSGSHCLPFIFCLLPLVQFPFDDF